MNGHHDLRQAELFDPLLHDDFFVLCRCGIELGDAVFEVLADDLVDLLLATVFFLLGDFRVLAQVLFRFVIVVSCHLFLISNFDNKENESQQY